jgi:hypothetical protein
VEGALDVLVLVPRGRVLALVIDGIPLEEHIGPTGRWCSPLGGGGGPEGQAALRRRLRLEDPPLIDAEREPLLVCTECGELDCGAVTARITAARGVVAWSDLGFEDGSGRPRELLPGAGPFRFEWRTHQAVLAPP